MVWHSMMCDLGLHDKAALEAPFAKWLFGQLRPAPVVAPSVVAVPTFPFRRCHLLFIQSSMLRINLSAFATRAVIESFAYIRVQPDQPVAIPVRVEGSIAGAALGTDAALSPVPRHSRYIRYIRHNARFIGISGTIACRYIHPITRYIRYTRPL